MRIPWRALLAVAVAGIAGGAAYLWFAPSPIEAVAWQPEPRPPVAGALAQNGALLSADLIGRFAGPYGVALDREGNLYTGDERGRLWRVALAPNGARTIRRFADTGGRPLGLAFDRTARLLVADARRGLLAVSAGGAVSVLAERAGGKPLVYTAAVAPAPDGRIYFTEASDRGYGSELFTELLEARPHGRLLVRDPGGGDPRELLRDLYFPAGLALSPTGDFLLIAEQARYRIRRLWLTGSRAGRTDLFADNLPGLVGGLAYASDGSLWANITEPRIDLVDRTAGEPRLKNLLAKLPPSVLKGNEKGYGLVLVLDGDGRISKSLHDPSGRLNRLTGLAVTGTDLYMGTSGENGVGHLPLTR